MGSRLINSSDAGARGLSRAIAKMAELSAKIAAKGRSRQRNNA